MGVAPEQEDSSLVNQQVGSKKRKNEETTDNGRIKGVASPICSRPMLINRSLAAQTVGTTNMAMFGRYVAQVRLCAAVYVCLC
mmetsp:Transcript_49719/g.105877  ORF Transcript_49719/g.105877 Transcript_49719/m.105877 type:complete len:83 (-) Transcript_49719:984-1232(-)